MQVIDLSEATRNDYFTCLEEWSDEMNDGVCRKTCWYSTMRQKGLRGKMALNDAGLV